MRSHYVSEAKTVCHIGDEKSNPTMFVSAAEPVMVDQAGNPAL